MSNEDLFTMDIYQSDNVIVSNSKNQKIIKKILDIVVSLVLLIVTSPILLISCIAIRLESEGTAIYKQVRYGFLGKEFTAYKLRTMYNHSSDGNLSAPQKGDKDRKSVV